MKLFVYMQERDDGDGNQYKSPVIVFADSENDALEQLKTAGFEDIRADDLKFGCTFYGFFHGSANEIISEEPIWHREF